MKQLSRKKIQDMIDLNGANISSRRSSGGSGAGGGGGVSSAWVDEHYISKDFFARLFTINGTDENDDDVVVEPNDLETTITNIQAMVGLWTEEYLSALGQGSGGGGGGGALLTEPLASINEAGMGTPSGANKVIAWNGSTWTYMPYTTGSGTVTSVTMTVPTGFKVSNGDTQTINTTGSFDLTFGGTITKNQVLASPAAANGTPAWRALVADDIPTLTAAKISDITLTDGTLTIGNNSITPLTDATMKGNYTWWGQTMNSSGVVTGNITVGNGYILLNNDKGLFSYNAPAEGETAATIELMRLRSNNSARLFYGAAQAGYTTLVCGNAIGFRYGDGSTNAMVITQTGLITMGTSGTSSFVTEKLNVNGNIRTATANGSYIQIGAVRLVYDSTNTAIKVEKSDGTAAGLYATGFLSALGAGSGGGGGSTTLTEPLASINEAGMGSPSGTNKVIVYTSSGWSYMPYTNGGSGSVTSVGLSMPTGFNVTGTPVTGSGTLTVAFGGSVSKNRVLAAPSDAAGAPSWRKLVAADIPDLSGTYATDARMDTVEGYFNSSGYAKTAAKLSTVSKTLWGNTYWTSDGVPTNVGTSSAPASLNYVTNIDSLLYFDTTNSRVGIGSAPGAYTFDVFGNIHTSESIYLNNGKNIIFKDSGGTDRSVMGINSSNLLRIGYGHSAGGTDHETVIYGSKVKLYYYGTSRSFGVVLNNNGNVGIGSTDPLYKLHVNGYTKTSRLYLSDSVYLEYDSTKSGVHLVGAGLYADTYLSALGAGSGGGSGSGITMADVWQAMAYTAPSTGSQQIHVSHLAQALTTYATKTWVNDNFVTLVGAQSITGRKTFVSGLTTNGTTIINLGAKFYSICVECASDGTPDVNRSGEINRYNGKDLNLQYDTGTGNVTMCRNNLYFYHNSGMSYISSRNNDLQVYVGNGNPYIDKSWIVTSDERMKDIFGYVEASVKQIANAPIFNYRIKGDETEDLFLGTSAQCWQKIFPSAVREKPDGFFGFDYASAALAAAVMTARHVMTHEERIKALEKENKELRKQIETLKAS